MSRDTDTSVGLILKVVGGVVVLIVGLVAASVMKSAPSGVADFTPVAEAEQGPMKL